MSVETKRLGNFGVFLRRFSPFSVSSRSGLGGFAEGGVNVKLNALVTSGSFFDDFGSLKFPGGRLAVCDLALFAAEGESTKNFAKLVFEKVDVLVSFNFLEEDGPK